MRKIVQNRPTDFLEMIRDEYANDTDKIANNAFLFMMDFVRENKVMTLDSVVETPEYISSLTKNKVSLLLNIEVFKYNTISKLENF
ncbi:MAG: hypothetical protein IJ736_12800, partial [Firmicutes bacterium]|nr:hypothetical protein [Bacillota bacterium]